MGQQQYREGARVTAAGYNPRTAKGRVGVGMEGDCMGFGDGCVYTVEHDECRIYQKAEFFAKMQMEF